MSLLCIIILVFPSVLWKLYRDRKGRSHPDYVGVAEVLVLWMLGFISVAFIKYPNNPSPYILLLQCLAVSLTGHGLFFNYLWNLMWWSRWYTEGSAYWWMSKFDYVFNHLSDSAIPDRWHWWRSLGWAGRLSIYVSLFISSIIWFIS